MTATLALKFEDGSKTEIAIQKVIEIDVPDHGRNEISFRQTNKGWVMAITKPLLDEHKLTNHFLTAIKDH